MLRPIVKPMLARNVTALPAAGSCSGGCAYEPKWDGYRCVLFRHADGKVEMQSRAGTAMAAKFPEIARLARDHLPAETVVDGELIIWDRQRLSFALLQRRFAASPRKVLDWVAEFPAHLVLFDVLHSPAGDVMAWPLRDRRALLEELLAGGPTQLPISPQTTSEELARDWLTTWPAAGVEGLVIKGLDEPYRDGRRGWLKLRERNSTEAIVGGVTGSIAQPETLLLGRRDAGGVLRFVGRTRPLTVTQRAEVRGQLHRPGSGRQSAPQHPWPRPLPAGWIGQFGSPEPLAYQQVEPEVVAEVQVDAAYEAGRWRHQAKFLRVRTDMSIYDVPLAGLEP